MVMGNTELFIISSLIDYKEINANHLGYDNWFKYLSFFHRHSFLPESTFCLEANNANLKKTDFSVF